MTDDNTFTCAVCGGTFPKAWTDEEAEEEAVRAGFGDVPAEERALVCDVCYPIVMALNGHEASDARE